jgi:hypothetical protein
MSPSLTRAALGRFSLVCLLLWLPGQSANAASPNTGGYVFAKGQQHAMRIGSTRFQTPAASIAGGYWFGQGMGLELEFSTATEDVRRRGIDLDIDQLASLGVRLEAPPRDDLALYFVFSLTSAEVSSRFSSVEAAAVASSLDGYGVTFGMTWQTAVAGLVVDTGATHHRFESDIGINTLHIGLRYSIGAVR